MFINCHCYAQTLGGASTFNFLKLPATSLVSAAGGINTSYSGNDAGLALNNPALLTPELNSQLNLSFNSFYAGIHAYHLAGAYQVDKWNTTLGSGVFFIDYGAIPQRDAAGNDLGGFRAKDIVLQMAAGKKYGQRWNYGITTKLILSDYQLYKSTALAFDIGLLYKDSIHLLAIGMVARNMGMQFKGYAGQKEDLPFDLEAGVTKKLEKAPLGFSLTLQQLHRFDLLYNDSLYNNDNNFSNSTGLFNKLFNHVVIATHIYLGNNLEVLIGYNQLRRSELNIGSSGNGFTGFSLGFQAKFKKLQLQYARSYYQRGLAYNQFGLGVNLKQMLSPL